MIVNLYSIYDRKSNTYSNIFSSLNDAVAIRQFTQAVNDSNSIMSVYPNDFVLCKVGSFDNVDSILLPVEHKFDHIAEASAVKIFKEDNIL